MGDSDTLAQIVTCPACAGEVDASGISIGSIIVCPHCQHNFRLTLQFGSFLLEQQIGSGGMGAVYKGIDLNLKRSVAIKVLKPELSADQKFISTFLYEAEITASLNHPNIVQVYAFGEHNGQYYLVMENISGGSLDDRIVNFGGVTELEGIEIGIAVAAGLKFAHERGLIHRDIKPGNILFGNNNLPKVVDFGLSLSKDTADKFEGEIWGTPYYVPPEKLEQKPEDFRSDLYSLGTTLFHAIGGRPPYDDPDCNQVALKHLKGSGISVKAFAPHVSNQTSVAISTAMARYPEDRYQSYEEFIAQLEDAKRRLLEKGVKSSAAPSEVAIVPPPEGGKSTAIIIGVVLALAIALVGFFVLGPKSSQKKKTHSELEDYDPTAEVAKKPTPAPASKKK
jgi:serine/threonine protein kinase